MKTTPLLGLRVAAIAMGLTMATLATAAEPVLIIHGGAGVIRRNNNAADEAAIRQALETALKRGHAELAAGARRNHQLHQGRCRDVA